MAIYNCTDMGVHTIQPKHSLPRTVPFTHLAAKAYQSSNQRHSQFAMSHMFKNVLLGYKKYADGDDDGDDGYDYAPAACIEGGGDDDDGDYDYAPAASMEGDDDDDSGYDYAPAA